MIGSFICGGIFDLAVKEKRITELDQLMASQNFWDDQEAAKATINESNRLKEWVDPAKNVKQKFEDIQSLLPEAYEIGDPPLIQELLAELDQLESTLSALEIRKMLSGELDNSNCYLSINAGAGGTESCDWVAMLSRMYQRWAISHQWKVDLIDTVDGDVTGYKSLTFKFTGSFAYGYAKAEQGVHRLVRISPFDSNARRHTSFASVDIIPEIADSVAVEIRPDDLRIDTYRASGAGGQHVNKTDSAVRITHLPTGIVVSCQSERSQVQNKETCFKMLRSTLYERELAARQAKLDNLSGEKKAIAWGSQIRSYVFQPYTLVKDNRTKVEVGNIQAVMDGDLDPFVYAYLKEFGSTS